MHLSLEPVSVSVALEEAMDLIQPLATERSVNLFRPSQNETDFFVLADHQRLKQVLLNLLNNGVKYTPPGGSVMVSCKDIGGKVRLAVHDTGVGIAADKLERVFTPFDRLGAEQAGIEGTGLGLALSKRLVRAMRGVIGVESIEGQGSTFWLELVRQESPLDMIPAKSGPVARSKMEKTMTQRSVLYIEDNLSNLTLIEHLLREDAGFHLLTAMQGRIGLDLARQHSPDLILLDLHLPDIPGWDVLAELQGSEATRHIPTIIVSADATEGQCKRLLDAGARDYITKPIDVDGILSRDGADRPGRGRMPRRLTMETEIKEIISCPSEPAPCSSSESGCYRKSKILVIDDEPANAELLEAILADFGYQDVKAITDSRIALEVCRTFEPDLVLLDLMMPHVDGFAILEALGSEPPWGSLPVMVLTADENNETRLRALNAGATDFILKPFDLAEALLRIERLLALRHQRDNRRAST